MARTPPSILVGVELSWPCHCDGERPQRVQNLYGAAVLTQTFPYLPSGVHVAIVDPGVGTTRRGIAVEAGEAILVGPDNGLLSWAAGSPHKRRGAKREDWPLNVVLASVAVQRQTGQWPRTMTAYNRTTGSVLRGDGDRWSSRMLRLIQRFRKSVHEAR